MTNISELSEQDLADFLYDFEFSKPIVQGCLKSILLELDKVLRANIHSADMASKYLKFHVYALVSSIVDTIAASKIIELGLNADKNFDDVINNIKANVIYDVYNSSVILKLPAFSPIHGQDILLFRAIEHVSLQGELSIFGFKEIKAGVSEYCLQLFFDAKSDTAKEQTLTNLFDNFTEILVNSRRLTEIDMSFKEISCEINSQPARVFINEFTAFMRNLADNVYHCHNGSTFYSGKGLSFECACGNRHYVDSCEAICDLSSSFVVLVGSCNSAIVKVVPEGFFKVKGLKVASQISTKNSAWLNLAKEAVSSRKRFE